MIHDLSRKRKEVQIMPKLLCQVLVTSKTSVLENHVMDWAFVEFSDEAQDVFRSNTTFEVPQKQQPNKSAIYN